MKKEKKPHLEVIDLHVEVDGKEILKGVNLEIGRGEIHCLMGRNGSGKSTLAYALMGHPKCRITHGKIIFNGDDVTNLPIDRRAKLGIFLSFQYPEEIPGVTIANFLRVAYNSAKSTAIPVIEFQKMLREKISLLGMDEKFARRSLNEGFSGGEKKKAEILQMAVLRPSFAILDETDSGLDVDALKTVASGINKIKTKEQSILLITHYQRILNYIAPDRVHVMSDGKIVKSGGKDLIEKIESEGYDWVS